MADSEYLQTYAQFSKRYMYINDKVAEIQFTKVVTTMWYILYIKKLCAILFLTSNISNLQMLHSEPHKTQLKWWDALLHSSKYMYILGYQIEAEAVCYYHYESEKRKKKFIPKDHYPWRLHPNKNQVQAEEKNTETNKHDGRLGIEM